MLTQSQSALDLQEMTAVLPGPAARDVSPPNPSIETVDVWGLPLARMDMAAVLARIDDLIERGDPAFFITANLHYARLSAREPQLNDVNSRAAFITADGMPMIWYSRLTGRPLPQRVAGSELVELLSRRAEERGYRVFFLGGAEGVARRAADRLLARHPRLAVAGVEAPEFSRMNASDHAALVRRIRSTRPDILFAALGQPKGELWIDRHCAAMGVPACVQIGASLDFLAGSARRAPRWMQRAGAEWLYRMAREPRRLAPRYFRDAMFLCGAIAHDLTRGER